MENFVIERVRKVLNLISKNRAKIRNERVKLERFQNKIQVSQERLKKLQIREEQLRDRYDLYYKSDYDDDDPNKIRTINSLNMKIYSEQFDTAEQKQNSRVQLPDAIEDI